MGLIKAVNKGKDLTVAKALKYLVNNKIENYGKVGKFKLDSLKKTIAMDISLKGENESITIDIINYKFEKVNNEVLFLFSSVNASRKWLTNLINDFLSGNKIKIPEKIAGVVKSIM
ncbi:MAG: hypothetical protein GY714_32575 [Desulfobacterales bacterium]|nr:hypothetical protein [Desulfobacterales bacterium]MCP4160094.1 hypothetical protein [Deltaproteobacteria bacterium]